MLALVKVPECWVWSYNSKQKTICCTFPNILPDASAIIKVVNTMNSQQVSYNLNGRVVSPIGLERKYTSMEDISKLIVEFDRKRLFGGVDPSLQDVKVSARFAGIESCRLKVPARLSGVIADWCKRTRGIL